VLLLQGARQKLTTRPITETGFAGGSLVLVSMDGAHLKYNSIYNALGRFLMPTGSAAA
jgi:hypothetical protein